MKNPFLIPSEGKTAVSLLPPWRKAGKRGTTYLLFFIAVLIYFVFFENYGFFYQEKSSLFIFSFDFLRENIKQPGGFVIWLGKFFSTFYYYPLAGGIILSTALTVTVISTSKIISFLSGEKSIFIPLIIGVSLFYLNTDYHFLLFNTLGLLFQLTTIYYVIKNQAFIKGWLPVILAPLSYYLTGGFALIFLLFTSFYLIFHKENYAWIKIPAIWIVSLITFYISKEFLFFQSVKTLIIFPFSGKIHELQQILYISVAALISILPVLVKVKFSLPGKLRVSDFSISLITSILLIAVITAIGFKRYDFKARQYFFVEKLFYEGKFEEVIAFNKLNPPTNQLTIFLNNIALCETGQLDDNLFHFLQSPDGRTLFLKWDMVEEILRRGAYFYYAIGMINEAHRWAFENMVIKGQTPEGLKMLIKTDLINGNYKVAAAYISVLKRTLYYRNEAKKFELLLTSGQAFNTNKELAAKRQTKVENDFFTITDNPSINLEMILAGDSLNRKAFEYKIANMLLQKNFQGITHELPEFEKFGYKRLPVHIEEAVLALASSNKGNFPDLGHLQISNNTQQRWSQFLGVLHTYRNDVRAAEPVLKSRFGDTFWYYVFYK
jgi:hypothetical protein